MRSLILILFPLYAFCQSSTNSVQLTYQIPVQILDSLIFETKLGRACESVRQAQTIEINAITAQLNTQGKAIQLQKDINARNNEIIGTFPAQLEVERNLGRVEKGLLKAMLKRLQLIAIGEGVGIAVLVLVIVGLD